MFAQRRDKQKDHHPPVGWGEQAQNQQANAGQTISDECHRNITQAAEQRYNNNTQHTRHFPRNFQKSPLYRINLIDLFKIIRKNR